VSVIPSLMVAVARGAIESLPLAVSPALLEKPGDLKEVHWQVQSSRTVTLRSLKFQVLTNCRASVSGTQVCSS